MKTKRICTTLAGIVAATGLLAAPANAAVRNTSQPSAHTQQAEQSTFVAQDLHRRSDCGVKGSAPQLVNGELADGKYVVTVQDVQAGYLEHLMSASVMRYDESQTDCPQAPTSTKVVLKLPASLTIGLSGFRQSDGAMVALSAPAWMIHNATTPGGGGQSDYSSPLTPHNYHVPAQYRVNDTSLAQVTVSNGTITRLQTLYMP
ncbi:hypothetical protein [Flexivirga meconopsidis]|uniref:hypothetical protein n=1 Tax=Flexivirga meconopsidis TaxID=2977121 RepID=UPI00223ED44E|nr:hypothetical protein [Flexivirga meconopsidis]